MVSYTLVSRTAMIFSFAFFTFVGSPLTFICGSKAKIIVLFSLILYTGKCVANKYFIIPNKCTRKIFDCGSSLHKILKQPSFYLL